MYRLNKNLKHRKFEWALIAVSIIFCEPIISDLQMKIGREGSFSVGGPIPRKAI
jgi:hypothetical protein